MPLINRPAPDDDISKTVKDFIVDYERVSLVQYKGRLTVRFYPDEIKSYLSRHNKSYTDTKSNYVLIVPILHFNGQYELWSERTPWYNAWENALEKYAGLVPIKLPYGDLQDVSIIAPNEAVDGQFDPLMNLAERYGAGDVSVVVLEENAPSYEVNVTHYYQEGFEEKYSLTKWAAHAQSDSIEKSVYYELVQEVLERMNRGWKEKTSLKGSSEKGYLLLTVPIAQMSEWVDIQNRLNQTSLITDVDLKSFGTDEVSVGVSYKGNLMRLQNSLRQKDLNLSFKPSQTGNALGEDVTNTGLKERGFWILKRQTK